MQSARNITIIPAQKKNVRKVEDKNAPKCRVAAYCRVSTDSDEQATSYETQVEHYTKYIREKPDWEFAGIYADDGISGTNTKKRDDFNRMISDCKNGAIDMIITKSISRFARNTLDCLKYIRQLKDLDIPVFFEKENINTMDSKGEVLLTIMASLAQQESQSMSQNIRMGYQFRFQEGKVMVNYTNFLGYTKDDNGQLVIVPEEARVVKRIFREYLEGSSTREISKGLEADGILTGAHKPNWRAGGVMQILQNEKYMGDALLQKTYTVDYLNKKKIKNNGIAPQYYVENSHEAIIPKDLFMKTQEEIKRRASLTSANGKRKRAYSSKYALSGRVECGHCGDTYRRIKWNNRGCRSTVWRCLGRIENGKNVCGSRTVREEQLHEVVLRAFKEVMELSDDFFDKYKTSLKSALGQDYTEELRRIEELLRERQIDLLKTRESAPEYDGLVSEIYSLREEQKRLLSMKTELDASEDRIDEIMLFIRERPIIKEYNDVIVRRFIDRIEVYDNKFTVRFLSGIETDIYE